MSKTDNSDVDLSLGGIKIVVTNDWEYGNTLFFSTDGQHFYLNPNELSLLLKVLSKAEISLKKRVSSEKRKKASIGVKKKRKSTVT